MSVTRHVDCRATYSTCVTSYRTRPYARTQPLRGHPAFRMKYCVRKVDHLCLMRDYILLDTRESGDVVQTSSASERHK